MSSSLAERDIIITVVLREALLTAVKVACHLELTARQRTELLLMASQSVFLVALLSKLSVSWKGALALASLFVAEWLLVAIQPNKDATLIQGAFSALYLGTAAIMFLADRSRLGLLAGAIAPRTRGVGSAENTVAGTVISRQPTYRRPGDVVGVVSAPEAGESMR